MKTLKGTIKTLLVCGILLPFSVLSAEEKDETVANRIELGEVVVAGSSKQSKDKITSDEIDMNEKSGLSDALNILPGVLNVHGAKTDMVYVRGFNQRQVPVFYDGVPIYIPYDGYVDLSMLLAADVSKINIATGTNSLLYGPNALGGAINIVTAKPKSGFSFKIKGGSFTNGKYSSLASIGYGAEKYYVRVGYSILDKEDFRLSDDYKPAVSIESGGDRDNSYRKMSQFSAKVGFTPSMGHEYAIYYVKHNGKKGIPPYVGTSGSSRFWKFPVYDKESVYLLSRTNFGNGMSLKTRIFYDKFDNTLDSYDDSTYSTQNSRKAFTSIYDDYSVGGIGTFSYVKGQNTALLDVQYKYDSHKEHDVGDPIQKTIDQSAAVSLIDNYYMDKIILHGGVSMNYADGKKAQYLDKDNNMAEYPTNENTVFNWEANVTYKFLENNEIKGGIAYKTRFPTMKDRYSQRFGKSIANPDLKDENSLNFTLDYAGSYIDNKLKIEAGVFYSHLKDAIIEVSGVDSADSRVYQLQNTGKARYYGGDCKVSCSFLKSLTADIDYSFVKRENITSPDDKFTDVPEHSLHISLVYWFKNHSYLDLNAESYSDRYTYNNGDKVGGYTLYNFKGAYYLYKHMVSLEAGINNIFDKNYQVSDGYPMPGRNCFASLVVKL